MSMTEFRYYNKPVCPKCGKKMIDVRMFFSEWKERNLSVRFYCDNCDIHRWVVIKKANLTFGDIYE